MDKLLPCPLCGGEPLYGYNGHENWIECLDCGLSIAVYGRAFSAEYVEGTWNTRHTPEGWQLVPLEVTHRMSLAGKDACGYDGDYLSAYDAMLDAAPKWEG